MNNLYVVITDFNGYTNTRLCLEALSASDYQKFKVVVVDHGTNDATRIGLAVDFPTVIRLEGSSELWWTGATNLGVRAAIDRGADVVMLLNNDCYVTPETIAILMGLSRKNPDAIIAPVQRDLHTGKLTSISPRSCFLLGFPTIGGPQKLTRATAGKELLPVKLIIGGRGVLIPSEIFLKISLFDEKRLPHYGADHDFYLRVRKHRIPLYVATQVVVDIDNNNTTMASDPGIFSFSGFLRSLNSIHSHRNLHDVITLFKAHYPIPYLYYLGVAFCLGRYLLVFWLKRALFLMRVRRN